MKRLLMIAFALAGSMSLAIAPASAAPASSFIASCQARGAYAICDAAGTAGNHPVTIVMHVRAVPRQSVSGAWAITCSEGLGAGSKSASFHGRTPINRILRHPYRHPDSCVVSADAQLSRHGHLHIWLTYTS
jgi:hypothetical protein